MNEHVEPAKLEIDAGPHEVVASAATNLPLPRRSRFPRRLAWLVVLLLVLAAGFIWWEMRGAGSVSYVTATVDRGAITKTVAATGTVNPVLTVTVGSYVSGVVQDVLCDFNTKVTKGQVCARIDARPF